MSESDPTFTPPTIESQYSYYHPSNVSPERLAEMKRQIAEFGVYVGEVMELVGDTGAIEVIEPENSGDMLKIMPNAVRLPHDHPARKIDESRNIAYRAIAPFTYMPRAIGHRSTSLVPAEHQAPKDDHEQANRQANLEVAELGTTNEALSNFLQLFVAAADESNIGYGFSDDCELVNYHGSMGMHRKFVKPFGEEGVEYALLRGDMMVHRRPQAADEYYTVVNMDTGDELGFAYSDVERVRHGEYVTTTSRGKTRALSPRKIAGTAGIVDPHGTDDPLVALKADGAVLAAMLETDEQIQRFERLVSLGSSVCENAHVTFAPASAEELMTFLTRLGADDYADRINALSIPEGSASIAISEDNPHILKALLRTVSKFDEETQTAIYRTIDSVSVDMPRDAWTRAYEIENLIRQSISIEDGVGIKRPAAELLKRLSSNRYDFLEAIYRISGGMYVEGYTSDLDTQEVVHFASESLDEERARIYAEAFEWELTETVDVARAALGIPEDIDRVDQIVMLLQGHGYTQKGMRLVQSETVSWHRPDISVPEWAAICVAIDRCRDNPITDDDRAVVEGYGLSADAVARYWEYGPGSSSERIAEALVRPLGIGR